MRSFLISEEEDFNEDSKSIFLELEPHEIETSQKILLLEQLNTLLLFQSQQFKLILLATGSLGFQFFARIYRLEYMEMFKVFFNTEMLPDENLPHYFVANEKINKKNQSLENLRIRQNLRNLGGDMNSLSFMQSFQGHIGEHKKDSKSSYLSAKDSSKMIQLISQNSVVQKSLGKMSLIGESILKQMDYKFRN